MARVAGEVMQHRHAHEEVMNQITVSRKYLISSLLEAAEDLDAATQLKRLGEVEKKFRLTQSGKDNK